MQRLLPIGLIAVLFVPAAAWGVDVPARYAVDLVDLKKNAPAGTQLTWQLYSDSACTTATGSPLVVNVEDVELIELVMSVQVNTSGFAGYSDWRIPEVNRAGGAEELETILIRPYHCSVPPPGNTPCVDTRFNNSCTPGCTVMTCSCTWDFHYWSSTTGDVYSDYAWEVLFRDGFVAALPKRSNYCVRAVRGGL